MNKFLFLIHDLGQCGAEKVLVNLVNNMDRTKFDITVMALFGGGINEQFLAPHIRLIVCHKKAIRGNSHIMKLFTPNQLYRYYIKEHYDVIVSYLEGPSARIVSGCDDPDKKLVCWIHRELKTKRFASASFRSMREATQCYQRFHQIVCVSDTVKQDFLNIFSIGGLVDTYYNTNESKYILEAAQENIPTGMCAKEEINLIGVGKIMKSKGFDRLARIQKRLRVEGYATHIYVLGDGPQRSELESYLAANNLQDSYSFLGYQTNPYKYVAKCDLFVCASHAEGFSTAATEALIVGTPVCTVEVSGMREMLGDNEYGIITENDEDALYEGIKDLLDHPEKLAHYKEKAIERGRRFSTEETVRAVEEMLLSL